MPTRVPSGILVGVSARLGDGVDRRSLVETLSADVTYVAVRPTAADLRACELSGAIVEDEARGLAAELPGLAIVTGAELGDPARREHFARRVFAHARVRDFFAGPWDAAGLVRFHSAEKIAVLAHDVEGARQLGRLVASQGSVEPDRLAARYRDLHAAALRKPPTPGGQANALMHLAGHLKDELSSPARRDLRDTIEAYRVGRLPLAVPLALLAHELDAAGAGWAASQTYLRPDPGR
jgi:uncharacterized protein YbgA (DUF1722 family)